MRSSISVVWKPFYQWCLAQNVLPWSLCCCIKAAVVAACLFVPFMVVLSHETARSSGQKLAWMWYNSSVFEVLAAAFCFPGGVSGHLRAHEYCWRVWYGLIVGTMHIPETKRVYVFSSGWVLHESMICASQDSCSCCYSFSLRANFLVVVVVVLLKFFNFASELFPFL